MRGGSLSSVVFIDQKSFIPSGKWTVNITGFGFGEAVDDFLNNNKGFNTHLNQAIISTRHPFIYLPGCNQYQYLIFNIDLYQSVADNITASIPQYADCFKYKTCPCDYVNWKTLMI